MLHILCLGGCPSSVVVIWNAVQLAPLLKTALFSLVMFSASHDMYTYSRACLPIGMFMTTSGMCIVSTLGSKASQLTKQTMICYKFPLP